MLHQLHHNPRAQAGFTLVELLVVMLVIGLLAAIAIPAFLNQRTKAVDASAKEAAHTARLAMETYSTTRTDGAYTGATANLIRAIEPTVRPNCVGTAPNYTNAPCLIVSSIAARTYRVTIWARTSRNSFSIARSLAGVPPVPVITYPCTRPTATSSKGGCAVTSGTAGFWN